jgi:hypothetical protein
MMKGVNCSFLGTGAPEVDGYSDWAGYRVRCDKPAGGEVAGGGYFMSSPDQRKLAIACEKSRWDKAVCERRLVDLANGIEANCSADSCN